MLVFAKPNMVFDEHYPTNEELKLRQIYKNATNLLMILANKIKCSGTGEQKTNFALQLNNTLTSFIETFGENKTVHIFCKACKKLGYTIKPVNNSFKMLLLACGVKFKSTKI